VQAGADPVDSVLNIGRDIVPVNIVQAAADANFLGVIAISIFFGVVLSSMGKTSTFLV
jgi:Na+/H+-dicarboxylate symporter